VEQASSAPEAKDEDPPPPSSDVVLPEPDDSVEPEELLLPPPPQPATTNTPSRARSEREAIDLNLILSGLLSASAYLPPTISSTT
jgi:hypothetical protein